MIGIVDKKDKTYDEALFALAGLEADTKPVSVDGVKVLNGSSFAEIDTGKDYLYDEANQTWIAQPASGAGADYSTLTNKPQINSVTLSGNKTAADLALVNDCDVTVDSSNVLHLTLKSGSTIIATPDSKCADSTKSHVAGDIGMWDVVNDKFYANSGTGVFIAG